MRDFFIEVEFVLDGGEGAEEQIGGVGHDGSAARVDLVPGLELIEFSEGTIDGDSGTEILGVPDEGGGEVGLGEEFPVFGSMFGAEAGVGVSDGQTAEALAGKTVLAMQLNRSDSDIRGFVIHDISFRQSREVPKWEELVYTPVVFV
jgi:hypothetical protein